MKNKSILLALLLVLTTATQCGIYSMSGSSTAADSMTIEMFFNNTDLAPANFAPSFTNRLKDYFQQNSSLRILTENGQLHIEGVISDYRISPVAPVATNPNQPTIAALSRLTITVRVNFEDTLVPTNSFKDKSFSFYRDFDNNLNFTSVQEELEKKIVDQILIDIFNATVANW